MQGTEGAASSASTEPLLSLLRLLPSLAAALKAAGEALCAALPCHFGCSETFCLTVTTVSEAFALVRGQSCVCGGCTGPLQGTSSDAAVAAAAGGIAPAYGGSVLAVGPTARWVDCPNRQHFQYMYSIDSVAVVISRVRHATQAFYSRCMFWYHLQAATLCANVPMFGPTSIHTLILMWHLSACLYATRGLDAAGTAPLSAREAIGSITWQCAGG